MKVFNEGLNEQGEARKVFRIGGKVSD